MFFSFIKRFRLFIHIFALFFVSPFASIDKLRNAASIKSTDSRSGCASCGGGCHACGGGSKDGLLVVQGNIVDALNVSGKDLWIGNKVGVFISEKAARFQGLCAVGIPLVLSMLSFTVIFLQTHNESLALAGIAAGLAAGAAIAFGISRILKERALPQIVTVYD